MSIYTSIVDPKQTAVSSDHWQDSISESFILCLLGKIAQTQTWRSGWNESSPACCREGLLGAKPVEICIYLLNWVKGV